MTPTPFSMGAFMRDPQAFRPTPGGVASGITRSLGGSGGFMPAKSSVFELPAGSEKNDDVPAAAPASGIQTGSQDRQRALVENYNKRPMPSLQDIMAVLQQQQAGPQMAMPGLPPMSPMLMGPMQDALARRQAVAPGSPVQPPLA